MKPGARLRVLSWNVNGIRAVAKKGFPEWLRQDAPDILCCQETKAAAGQVGPEIREPEGYRAFWSAAERPGYSGTVTFAREEPDEVKFSFGRPEFDREGRVVVTRQHGFWLYNVYFPNGKQSRERLAYKLRFYDSFLEHLDEQRKRRRKLIVCGDVNTAHKEIDLEHPKANENVSGFLKTERAWLDRLVEQGFVDTFRAFHPGEPKQYTWWSLLARARERNVGWRIDYFFVSRNLAGRVRDAFILPEVMGSDHCPVGIVLEA